MIVWKVAFDRKAFRECGDKKTWLFVYPLELDEGELPADCAPTAEAARSLAMIHIQALIAREKAVLDGWKAKVAQGEELIRELESIRPEHIGEVVKS
jgi:hypothetical protein